MEELKKNAPLIDAIAQAARRGLNLNHSVDAEVVEVVQEQPTKLCLVRIGDSKPLPAEYFFPGKPAVGARCIIHYRGNQFTRPIASDFSEYESVDLAFGAGKLQIEESELTLELGAFKIQTDGSTSTTLEHGPAKLEAKQDGSWEFTGPVHFLGEVTAAQKIKTDVDVEIAGKSVAAHIHPYTDSPVGNSTTGPMEDPS